MSSVVGVITLVLYLTDKIRVVRSLKLRCTLWTPSHQILPWDTQTLPSRSSYTPLYSFTPPLIICLKEVDHDLTSRTINRESVFLLVFLQTAGKEASTASAWSILSFSSFREALPGNMGRFSVSSADSFLWAFSAGIKCFLYFRQKPPKSPKNNRIFPPIRALIDDYLRS